MALAPLDSTFCEGYAREPFRSLCAAYPRAEAYSPQAFHVEWGPVFHRGRLDGSARVFVLAMAPARMEVIARRVMVGEDGPRMQGFLARLGVTRSYVILNTFLYSIAHAKALREHGEHPGIVAYRHAWMDALVDERIDAVISLGGRAAAAWELWKATEAGRRVDPVHVTITHPTQPESAARGHQARHAEAMAKMLERWNEALEQLRPAIRHADAAATAGFYGRAIEETDLQPVPAFDLPAGTPDWMRHGDVFAERRGHSREERRRSIVVTVPRSAVPA